MTGNKFSIVSQWDSHNNRLLRATQTRVNPNSFQTSMKVWMRSTWFSGPWTLQRRNSSFPYDSLVEEIDSFACYIGIWRSCVGCSDKLLWVTAVEFHRMEMLNFFWFRQPSWKMIQVPWSGQNVCKCRLQQQAAEFLLSHLSLFFENQSLEILSTEIFPAIGTPR